MRVEGAKSEAPGEDETFTDCGRCGRLGHAKTGCRNPKANAADGKGADSSGRRSSQVTTATATTSTRGQFNRSGVLVTDWDASHHMTYSRNTMYDFKSVTQDI